MVFFLFPVSLQKTFLAGVTSLRPPTDSIPLLASPLLLPQTYVVNISGLGVKPLLDFSFFEHNFGPCFLHSKGDDPAVSSFVVESWIPHFLESLPVV